MARFLSPSPNMVRLTRLFGALSCALGAALLALAAPAGATGVESVRTVSNVAQIEWDEGGEHLRLSSNRIDIAVDTGSNASFSLTAYHFASGSGTATLSAPAPICASAAGPVPVALAAAWRGESLAPAIVAPATQVRAGEPLFFLLDYADGNIDPTRVDTVTGIILSKSGDRETLTITETGPDTGKFAGYIQTVPGSSPPGDCRLGVVPGDKILVESLKTGNQTPFITVELGVLFDPDGIVFDSSDGSPISGARVTLVDEATSAPARVFGDNGDAVYPSTVVSGDKVRDSSGAAYDNGVGAYRFPQVQAGRYRMVIEAPPGYHAPSARSPAELASLIGPDGAPYQIGTASYGAAFAVTGPGGVSVAIPLDKIGKPIELVKTADRGEAAPGDSVVYSVIVRNPDPRVVTSAITLTDHFPAAMRLRTGTIRVNNRPAAARIAPDGRSFDVDVPPVAAGQAAEVSYGMDVLGTAPDGETVNRVEGHDDKGTGSNVADAAVRIRRDAIADRVTIEGRVTDGGCDGGGRGIAGVRIIIEDGSYAVTDPEGRYHFEGVTSGTHVVQLDDTTLPVDRAAVDCRPDTRSGGRAFSRFVDGRGGDLKRVDFHAAPAPPRAPRGDAARARPAPASDAA
ncbi:MAG: hypothetical protein JWO81_3321, partial [Alphaproteobacteria bacterium]|nr:hypothetical protein [Alphaproteobacteria bacterium]